ncbi:MBL fold metallo-hydrolase [Streptomyces sp. TS71-3]|uniref:MBL fold metallo-hydrolase n=1 Tax=Streptomyces sp. TS71-3 TaxID=2733862 RepID=UPI001B0E4116|nr:MBL fold metallo-hydrolase [Streptomyces sp. TS71-3]GHJ37664.1 MBL fold hydrolase [Streptomyces sp. TS71-3]
MRVAWHGAGWEELSARAGRCRLPGWDCTSGLVAGRGAALLVDAGSTLAEGARLRAAAEGLLGPGSRVTHLALTHPHFDHVLGAPAFADAQIHAAPGTGTLIASGADDLRADAVHHGVAPGEAAEAAALTRLVRETADRGVAGTGTDAARRDGAPAWHAVPAERTLDLGGGLQVLLVNAGPGHTAHDLAVLVPGGAGERDVVFCGDLVEESGEPQAGPDAVPERWPAALDRLLALGGPGAVYVPGHGAAVNAGFVRKQRDQLALRYGVS